MAGSFEADGLNWGFENLIGLRQVEKEICGVFKSKETEDKEFLTCDICYDTIEIDRKLSKPDD